MARGEDTRYHPNRSGGRDNNRMKAREDSYGESGEYEAEAKYASDYQKSLEPPDEERDEFKNDTGFDWLRAQFADNYRRGL